MPIMNVNEFSVDGYIPDIVAEYLLGFPSVDGLHGIHSYVADHIVGDQQR